MSGLTEIMASVSSRVVNTRAQEQLPSRTPVYTVPEVDEDGENDNPRYGLGNSSHPDVSRSSEVPPWAATSAGSEHGSLGGLRRSGSRHSIGSHAGGANIGARTSQQSHRGHPPATDHSRSGAGSQLGRSNFEQPEKTQQDEESNPVAGGSVHRGEDKIRLEGRSLKIFSPDNPLRLWLASVLMSK